MDERQSLLVHLLHELFMNLLLLDTHTHTHATAKDDDDDADAAV